MDAPLSTMGGMSIPFALVAAAALAVPPRVALSLSPAPMLPPETTRAAIAEAAAVWKPYGIAVFALDPAEHLGPQDVVLRVVFGRTPPARLSPDALGAIEFDADGMPGHVVTVFVDRVLAQVAHAHVSGYRVDDWPPALRNLVIGRAIGRVLAHEIGHFVLRTRGHAQWGLMRASHAGDDLVEPGRQRYMLRN